MTDSEAPAMERLIDRMRKAERLIDSGNWPDQQKGYALRGQIERAARNRGIPMYLIRAESARLNGTTA